MNSLFSELRRRNVIKLALAYIAVGWLIISIGDVLLPLLGAPDWVIKVLLLVIALGLPIVLVFAWVFELTPEGIKREKDVDRSQSIVTHTGRKLDYIVIAVLIAALSVSVYLNIAGERPVRNAATDPTNRHSIAVLPFTNRSNDANNAIFVDGIHDDLLTSLAHIAALKVISKTSVMQYRDTIKNLREIAEELGVATVLQGAVQRVGDNVRINVQLIDARTDDHIWVQTYDRELTTKNIFQIQSEISQRISQELQASLTPTEKQLIEVVPTENLEAYNLVRAGRHNLAERRFETTELARTQFEQAIELDPNYSDAYTGLADSLLLLRINHNAIGIEETYPLVQEALDEALAMDPQNADAHASLGLLKLDIWQQNRFGPELEEAELAFQKALELNPNSARAVMWYASAKASTHKSDEAIELYQRSLELDPLGRIPYANLPGIYADLGRNQEALDKWLDAVELHPGWPTPYQNIANHLQGLGRLDESIAWYAKASDLDTDPMTRGNALGSYLALGDTVRVLDFIEQIPEDHPFFELAPMFRRFFEKDYAGTVAAMDTLLVEGASPPGFALDIASDAALLGDDLESARRLVFAQQPTLADDPLANLDRFTAHHAIKLAYIAQRQGDPALAAELLQASLDALAQRPRLGKAGHGINDVQILALQGKQDEALDRLRDAIDAGFRGERSYENWTLEIDPYLASLRDQPRFRAMLEELQVYLSEMRQRALQAESTGNWEVLRALARTVPVNPAATLRQ